MYYSLESRRDWHGLISTVKLAIHMNSCDVIISIGYLGGSDCHHFVKV
jgi:hypothetical protein